MQFLPVQNKAENTKSLMTVPGLVDTMAVTVGNAYIIPADASSADKPWKTLRIDIDGQDCIFMCKDVDKPRHVHNIVPADTFDVTGIKYLFQHDPPPADFCRMVIGSGNGHLLGLPETKNIKQLEKEIKSNDY
jgi:hypothetical protein